MPDTVIRGNGSRRPRGLKWSGLLFAIGLLACVVVPAGAADDAVRERMRKDITFLASDACEGRGVTTHGIQLAADYVANEFKKAGLKPAGPGGSYFQPFTMPGNTLQGPARLVLHGPKGQVIELKDGEQFQVLGLSYSGKLTAPVVFAGYGVSGGQDLDYDDYADLEVAGKVVLVLRDTPRAGNKHAAFGGVQRQRYASLTGKMLNAEEHARRPSSSSTTATPPATGTTCCLSASPPPPRVPPGFRHFTCAAPSSTRCCGRAGLPT